MKLGRWLVIGALSLVCLAARAEQGGWQVSVELQPVGDSASKLPAVLVPKQSVLMKVVVWMPKDVNWYPQYPQWDMPGATLLPLMMLSPSVEREQDGFTQRGAAQNYLLTPLAEGELRLSPGQIKVHPDQGDSPVLPFSPVEIDVALPDGARSIGSFLPATKLTAVQRFFLLTSDGGPVEVAQDKLAQVQLRAGQMLERQITLEAAGIQGNQIPPLPIDSDVIQHEVEMLDLNNYGDFTGGQRTEHWFYAPGTRSSIELQPITIHWYDLNSRAFRTVDLQGEKISAMAIQQADSRLQISWTERAAQLLPEMLVSLLVALTLLVAAVRYGPGGARQLRRLLGNQFERVSQSEPFLYLNASCRLVLRGSRSPAAYLAFQRWLLAQDASQSMNGLPALQRWSRYRYAAQTVEPPRRVQLLKEMARIRLIGEEGSIRSRRHDLPTLQRGGSESE